MKTILKKICPIFLFYLLVLGGSFILVNRITSLNNDEKVSTIAYSYNLD